MELVSFHDLKNSLKVEKTYCVQWWVLKLQFAGLISVLSGEKLYFRTYDQKPGDFTSTGHFWYKFHSLDCSGLYLNQHVVLAPPPPQQQQQQQQQ